MTEEKQLNKKYSKSLSDKLEKYKLPKSYYDWIWNEAYNGLIKKQEKLEQKPTGEKKIDKFKYFKAQLDHFIDVGKEKFLVEKIRNQAEIYSSKERRLAEAEIFKRYDSRFNHGLVKIQNIPEHETPSIITLSIGNFLDVVKYKFYIDIDNPRSYFYRILMNNCKDFHKKNKRKKEKFIDDLNIGESRKIERSTLFAEDSLEEKIEKEELLTKLENAINKFDDSCREILLAIYFKGLKPKKIVENRKKSGKKHYTEARSISSRKYECKEMLRKIFNP